MPTEVGWTGWSLEPYRYLFDAYLRKPFDRSRADLDARERECDTCLPNGVTGVRALRSAGSDSKFRFMASGILLTSPQMKGLDLKSGEF